MSQVVRAVNDQQKAMVWALVAVRMAVRKALRSAVKPDFRQLKTLLTYVERFAEQQHQVNEDRHIFRPLETREPAMARAIALLRRDHSAMKGYRIRLEEALTYWEKGDPKAGVQAPMVAEDYLHFCQRHARKERDLLPALRRICSDTEWTEIERAYASVADPLLGAKSRRERMKALQAFD